MEVLARYCSIPGYNKLCCESCSKRSTQSPPFLTEAAETEDELTYDPSLSRDGMMPTSSAPGTEENDSETKSLLSILSSIENSADVGIVSPQENKPKASDSTTRRSHLAASKTFKLVAVPPPPTTRSSNVHVHKSPPVGTLPLAATNIHSTGTHSSMRSSRKNERPFDRKRSLQPSSIER